jgi:acetate kinase
MARALVFNPGSNSLKFEIVELSEGQQIASEGRTLARAMIDSVGKDARLQRLNGHEVLQEEPCEAEDMRASARVALGWLNKQRVDGVR